MAELNYPGKLRDFQNFIKVRHCFSDLVGIAREGLRMKWDLKGEDDIHGWEKNVWYFS